MKKSASYRETFRQHRLILTLPIIVSMLIGGWFALGAPKSYQSTTSLWVDSAGSAPSTLDNLDPAVTPPSQQEQAVVAELLATRDFVLEIGHQSLLASYVAHGSSGGSGLAGILGGGAGRGGSVDGKIIAALGPKSILTAVPGPQVLQISYKGPTPAVAQSTLRALVNVLQQESASFTRVHDANALAYYKTQMASASEAVSSARKQEAAYLRQHPGATAADPNFNALTVAVQTANSQLTQANSNLTSSSGATSGGSAMSVLDPATFPTSASSGKKIIVEGVLGGLIAGSVIAFLGTALLTRGRSEPWEDEVAEDRPAAPSEADPDDLVPVDPAPVEPAVAANGSRVLIENGARGGAARKRLFVSQHRLIRHSSAEESHGS
jgi:hypothetical protein